MSPWPMTVADDGGMPGYHCARDGRHDRWASIADRGRGRPTGRLIVERLPGYPPLKAL